MHFHVPSWTEPDLASRLSICRALTAACLPRVGIAGVSFSFAKASSGAGAGTLTGLSIFCLRGRPCLRFRGAGLGGGFSVLDVVGLFFRGGFGGGVAPGSGRSVKACGTAMCDTLRWKVWKCWNQSCHINYVYK